MSNEPGALNPDLPAPLDSMGVDTMNEMHAADRQARADRIEAESNPWHNVFGQ
jgi:hypothetical protein